MNSYSFFRDKITECTFMILMSFVSAPFNYHIFLQIVLFLFHETFLLSLSLTLSLAIFRSCISLLAPSSREICQTRSHQAHIHTLAHNHIRVISIRLHMNNRRAILKFGQYTQTHTKAQQ